MLRAELRKKYVPGAVIDAVIVDRRDTHDLVQEAKVLAQKRLQRLTDDPKAKDKVTAYLARRGYDYSVVREALAGLTIG